MADAVKGRDFGYIAAIDGWTLDSARHLGELTGYHADDVEAGFQLAVEERRARRP